LLCAFFFLFDSAVYAIAVDDADIIRLFAAFAIFAADTPPIRHYAADADFTLRAVCLPPFRHFHFSATLMLFAMPLALTFHFMTGRRRLRAIDAAAARQPPRR
jgi:hypothetical protein